MSREITRGLPAPAGADVAAFLGRPRHGRCAVTVNLRRDRPAPPALTPQYPLCGACGNEVADYDGSFFYCEDCDAYWDREIAFDSEGEWDEPDAKRCTSTNEYGGEQVRCVLKAGHKVRFHTAPFRRRTRSWRKGAVQ